jgi:hypothetical protein
MHKEKPANYVLKLDMHNYNTYTPAASRLNTPLQSATAFLIRPLCSIPQSSIESQSKPYAC